MTSGKKESVQKVVESLEKERWEILAEIDKIPVHDLVESVVSTKAFGRGGSSVRKGIT